MTSSSVLSSSLKRRMMVSLWASHSSGVARVGGLGALGTFVLPVASTVSVASTSIAFETSAISKVLVIGAVFPRSQGAAVPEATETSKSARFSNGFGQRSRICSTPSIGSEPYMGSTPNSGLKPRKEPEPPIMPKPPTGPRQFMASTRCFLWEGLMAWGASMASRGSAASKRCIA